MKKIPIIIDCDPGIDDVLAIVLALSKPNLEVLGITTVVGNVDGEKTTRNAKLLMNLLKEDIPVAQGALQPLVKKHRAANVHGTDGLADLSGQLGSDDYQHFSELNAVEFIRQQLQQAQEPITIVAVGPLTNIGLLLATYPHLKSKIKEISIMGGGLNLGNKTSTAEFNIYVDPEAAHIVLNSGVPLIVATLNATYQATLEKEDMQAFDFISNPAMEFINTIMWRYAALDSALHDPLSILAVSDPELFEYEMVKLNVETNEGATRGMTYIDHKGQQNNTKLITKLEREQVIKEIVQSLKYYNQ